MKPEVTLRKDGEARYFCVFRQRVRGELTFGVYAYEDGKGQLVTDDWVNTWGAPCVPTYDEVAEFLRD